MLLSIIIPTFNASATIRFCLDSIAAQVFTGYEVVVVDGLSTDDTMDALQPYRAAGMNLQIVSEKDSGIYDAMNKGMKLSKGDWLYFMGADDCFVSNSVLYEFAMYLRGDADLVYGNSIWVPEQRKEEGEWHLQQLLEMSINHQRLFYKKILFEQWGGFNTHYPVSSDYEMNIRFFCNPAIRKKFVDINVAFYHSGGYSAQNTDLEFWRNWKSVLYKNFIPYVKEKSIYERVSWYCWYLIRQKKYKDAAGLFCIIYFHSFSFAFLKHSLSQLWKSIAAVSLFY